MNEREVMRKRIMNIEYGLACKDQSEIEIEALSEELEELFAELERMAEEVMDE